MKIFEVGGCVRDHLMGKEPNDIDFVVVGSTPQEMLDNGFDLVGESFPVFLGSDGNEYALARTERKVGKGYTGFITEHNVDVTLNDGTIVNCLDKKLLNQFIISGFDINNDYPVHELVVFLQHIVR